MRARAAATAWALGALALAGCGGGDGGESATTTGPAREEVARDPSAQRLLRAATENYARDKADMIASLQTDARQEDVETLVDDLWDLRNVIYEFDQALRRIEFEPGAAAESVAILEVSRVAIARIDPILDAKDPPRSRIEVVVEKAVEDAEAIEDRANELVGQL